MKKALNILILLAIFWILATSGTESTKILFYNMGTISLLMWARVNSDAIVEFFNEKEEL